MESRIAVIGAGSWGTALGILLANKGLATTLYARQAVAAQLINEQKENSRYLPGAKLPDRLQATADLEQAVREAGLVVLSVPSHTIRAMVVQLRPFLKPGALVVNTAKGLELETLKRLSEVIREELPGDFRDRVAVLSGPSHAEEVALAMPTTVVVATEKKTVAEEIQDLFMAPRFRVYTNPDLIGVELGGALKNIIALCAGIAAGLGFGDNTQAAIITRGLAEIARLGVALGANALTFAGLAGVGDLVVTCTSRQSRNRRAGMALGQGRSLTETLVEVGMVVEGVRTTQAARELSLRTGVEMPIATQAYAVLFEGKSPADAVKKLMERGPTHEVEEVVRTTW